MKEGHCRGTPEGGSCGAETRGSHKAQHATQVIKDKWASKPALDQSGHQNGFARVTKTLEQRGPNVSVAHEVGCDSADYHANHKRWTDAAARYDQDAGCNS